MTGDQRMEGFDTLRLQTPRLLLRPLQPGDEGDLYAVYSDPVVMRYWSTPPWTDMAQARAMVTTDASAMPAGEHLRLGLADPVSGRLLGSCTLFNFSLSNRRAEIGYALAQAAWGSGLMHEALSALVAHGFGPLGLHRIEADIDPRNLASAHSLERLGFRLEGVLRERWIVNGEVSDTGYYGLLQREWLSGDASAGR